MTDLKDSNARQQALDIRNSFIVKAPAGSGKTTLLVKRYLKLLTVVNNPEEIIAITFTRKAAGELIARVLSALAEEPIKNTDDYTDHEMLDIARRARQRDNSKGWQLISNPSKLRIQTIDSLCNYIVRQMPWSAGFGAAPSTVSEDVSQYYLQAARQSLLAALSADQHKAAAERVLTALDNDFSRACELVKAMLARRDQWHGLLASHTGDEARDLLQANWAFVARHILDNCFQAISANDRNEIVELGQYAAKNLIDCNLESPIRGLNGLEEFPAARVSEISIWKAIAELLLRKNNNRHIFRSSSARGVTKKIGFPTEKDGGDADKKARFQELLSRLNNSELESDLAQIAILPDSVYSESEWLLFDSLLSLLRIAQRELLDIFQQRSCCDHIEIANRAVFALGQSIDEGGPSDLALRLDYEIKHLLVDEFQDTSQSQMLLLNRLTTGWHSGDARTVFFVGDPMQSIYRFRQADVALFLNIFNNGFENTPIIPLTLSTNFRSSKAVVDWINQTFAEIFPVDDDMQFGAVGYEYSSVHKPDSDQSAGQTTHRVSRQREAAEICRLVQTINQQTPKTSIAILVRSRSHLSELVVALRNSGVDYQGLKIEQLKNRSSIQDILALTSALLHFGDKLAWLAILRAPWCGISLPDLTLIASHCSTNTIWQVVNSPPQLSPDASTRLKRFTRILTPILDDIGSHPLHHVVARAWHALSGPDIITFDEQANINTYINLLGEIQHAGGLNDLQQLETAMEDLWAVSGNNDSQLQLMTIHTAKGLEFDVVILPGLSRRPRSDDSKLLIWKEFLINNHRSALLVSPIKQSDDDVRYKFVQALEKRSEREEIKRLLYVAVTRAKHQLHLFITPASTKLTDSQISTGSTLQSFLEPVLGLEEHDQPHDRPLIETDFSPNAVMPKYFRLPLNHIPKSLDNSLGQVINRSNNELVEYEWVGVSARHEGTLMHEIICQMANGTFDSHINSYKSWHNQLLSYGIDSDQIKKSLEKVQTVINQMTDDARAQWILNDAHTEAKNEWSLSAIVNGKLENIIIDRTFIDEHGVRWIIDYKTSTHLGANVELFIDSEFDRYRSQLENYAAILRLFESTPIKLGLYFPLLGAWREWDYVS